MNPPDIVRIVLELGYPWGGAALALVLIAAAITFRWKLGYKSLRRLLINWLVLVTTFGSALGFILYYSYFGLPSSFGNNEIGFLIAEVPGDTDRAKQETYTQAIRTLVAQSPELQDVKVSLIQRPLSADPVTQQEEAQRIGRRLRAAFVLRPVPLQGATFAIWLTKTDDAELRSHSSPQSPDRPSLECPLPPSPREVAESCVVLCFVRLGSCTRAASNLQSLLKDANFGAEIPSFLNFLRAGGRCSDQFNAVVSEYVGGLRSQADQLYNQKKYDDAITAYQKILGLKPDDPQALYGTGLALLANQQWDAAASNIRKAVRLDPGDPNSLNSLAYALYRGGHFDEAIARCREALEIRPNFSPPLNNLGLALAAERHFDEAIAAFRKSIAADPGNAWPHLNLGLTLRSLGRVGQAERELNEAVRLNPALRPYASTAR